MERFVQEVERSSSSMKLHACISFADDESAKNADAFLRGFNQGSAALKIRACVWPGADCLDIANNLAKNNCNVALLNGANRKLLGNQWFGRYARRAIDENLHRRSWTLSAFSYLLNNIEKTPHERPAEKLSQQMKWIGGVV